MGLGAGSRVGLPEEAGSSVMEGQIPTPSSLHLGVGVGSGISSASYTQIGHSLPKWPTLHAHLSASHSLLIVSPV